MKIRMVIPAALILGIIFFPACSNKSRQVRVEEGLISGIKGKDSSIRVFKGVPYAAPPVGDLRWRPPKRPEPWKGVRPADTFSPACTQNLERLHLPWTEEFMHQGEQSEDCLYLNIWTSARPEDEKHPVMVYIYGGGFSSGSNAVDIYDGEALAQKGVVVVGINYRVGPFGFLAHPELTKESNHRASGNYGLLDQASALYWISKNITAFGGDPDNVTIFGQSAGAMSVAMLMESPLAEGLFNRAIIQSGPGLFPGNLLSGGTSLEAAEQAGLKFAQAKGAANLKELRDLPADALLDASPEIRFGPIRDTWFLPANYKTKNQVPVINGFTADDMGAGGNYGPEPEATIQAYGKEARDNYGDMAQTFLTLYPAFTDSVVSHQRKTSGQDRARVSMYLWASKQAESGKDVFTYYFDRAIPWPEHPEFGAFHSGELPYVFNNLHLMDRPWEDLDSTIADQLSSCWTNFAKTGNPNSSDLPEWSPFDADEAVTMQIGERMGPMLIASQDKLEFWKKVLSETGSR